MPSTSVNCATLHDALGEIATMAGDAYNAVSAPGIGPADGCDFLYKGQGRTFQTLIESPLTGVGPKDHLLGAIQQRIRELCHDLPTSGYGFEDYNRIRKVFYVIARQTSAVRKYLTNCLSSDTLSPIWPLTFRNATTAEVGKPGSPGEAFFTLKNFLTGRIGMNASRMDQDALVDKMRKLHLWSPARIAEDRKGKVVIPNVGVYLSDLKDYVKYPEGEVREAVGSTNVTVAKNVLGIRQRYVRFNGWYSQSYDRSMAISMIKDLFRDTKADLFTIDDFIELVPVKP